MSWGRWAVYILYGRGRPAGVAGAQLMAQVSELRSSEGVGYSGFRWEYGNTTVVTECQYLQSKALCLNQPNSALRVVAFSHLLGCVLASDCFQVSVRIFPSQEIAIISEEVLQLLGSAEVATSFPPLKGGPSHADLPTDLPTFHVSKLLLDDQTFKTTREKL